MSSPSIAMKDPQLVFLLIFFAFAPLTHFLAPVDTWTRSMLIYLSKIEQWGVVLANAAPLFDASDYIHANGYRSLLNFCRIFVERVVLSISSFVYFAVVLFNVCHIFRFVVSPTFLSDCSYSCLDFLFSPTILPVPSLRALRAEQQ